MRKILLTTTALVALGGVSAASALEISGNYAFTYTDESNTGGSADAAGVSGDSFGNDMQIDFKNEITTDNGLTWGVAYKLNGTPASEDMGITVTGDMGRFMMGQTDGPVDANDGFMIGSNLAENLGGPNTAANEALETANAGSGLHTAGTTTDSNSGNIGYSTPNINGFQVHLGYEDGGSAAGSSDDTSGILLTYDMGFVRLGYASVDTSSATDNGADTKETLYGGQANILGATVRVGFHNSKTDDTQANGGGTLFDIDTRDVGFAYDVNDSLNIHYANIRSEEKGNALNAGDKLESQVYGLYYTIAPGITANLEYSESDYTDATAGSGNSDGRNQTFGFIKVSF